MNKTARHSTKNRSRVQAARAVFNDQKICDGRFSSVSSLEGGGR